MKNDDIHSLSHTKWNCKYHIVFAPKYRRKVFYGEKRAEIGKILRELCNWKKINIINAECNTRSKPNKINIHIREEVHIINGRNTTENTTENIVYQASSGFLKGKSSIMIYEKWGNMK